MSSWRGGSKSTAFRNNNHNTNGGSLDHSNDFNSSNTDILIPFATANRGGGGGERTRGGRGPRGRGGGALRGGNTRGNLSWKRATQSTSATASAFGSSGTLGSNPSLPSSVFAPISTTLVASPQLPPEEEVEEDSDVEKEEEAVGEEEADRGEEEVMMKKERNPAQISTLEVLGQDSDARRKRFESSLPNNRYLELKPLREEQRLKAIKQGLIPDPSKPMRLDQARDFKGTCLEMCPEWERQEREYQNNVDPLERYPLTTRIDPSRAVKAFHRPAAGNDQPLPSDVRPPRILFKTLDYLFHDLLPRHSFATSHPFIRDRTRSIRQDFTVQNVRDESAIESNERIARYHILALGTLREHSGFSESQELEQLRKVLKSLNEFYDDLRLKNKNKDNKNISFKNEGEFRSYHLLTHLRDPDIVWSTESLLPLSVFNDKSLQLALSLHRLVQKSNQNRGERASLNQFSRFFKLVKSDKVPFMFACLLSTHFNEIRRNALQALKNSYLSQHSAFPLKTLTKLLGCDDELETKEICQELGILVKSSDNKLVAELHKAVVLKSVTSLKPRISKTLVTSKLGSNTYQSVIDGQSKTTPSPSLPPGLNAAASPFVPTTINANQPPSFSLTSTTTTPQPALLPRPATTSSSSSSRATSDPFSSSIQSSSVEARNLFSVAAPLPLPRPVTSPPPQSVVAANPTPPLVVFRGGGNLPPPFSTVNNFTFGQTPQPQPPVIDEATTTITTKTITTKIDSPAPPPPPPPPIPIPQQQQQPILRRISQTVSRHSMNSPKLSLHPQKPSSSSTFNSADTDTVSKIIDHKPLIDSLTRTMTVTILKEFIQTPLSKISQEILKNYWKVLNFSQNETKFKTSEIFYHSIVEKEMICSKFLREEIFKFLTRELKLKRNYFQTWKVLTRDKVENKIVKAKREKEWRQVIESLGKGGGRDRDEDDDDDDQDEEIFDVEEEEEGEHEEEDGSVVELGLQGGLSTLSIDKLSQYDVEEDMAIKIKVAAENRQRIWARSTFLDILSFHLSSRGGGLLLQLPSSSTFTTLLSTRFIESSFAIWLACKFNVDSVNRFRTTYLSLGLGGTTTQTQTRNQKLKFDIKSLQSGEEPKQDELDTTGLIVFDCTSSSSSSRDDLKTLISNVDKNSLFRPYLVVLVCPNRSLNLDEELTLRESMSRDLDLISLSKYLSGFSIMIVKLDGSDEKDFERETIKLVSSISIRRERIRQPLNRFTEPLLSVWRTSLRSNLDRFKRDEIASIIVSSFIEQLQEIVTEIQNAIHPPPATNTLISIPSFPDVVEAGSLRSAIESYISKKEFSTVDHYFLGEISTAFAQRPRMSDHHLARLILDLLDQFTVNTFDSTKSLKTLQLNISDEIFKPKLEKLEDSLIDKSETIRNFAKELEETRLSKEKEEIESTRAIITKKRKASITINDTTLNRSPKKIASNGFDMDKHQQPPSQDRLTALEKLMKETKALLST